MLVVGRLLHLAVVLCFGDLLGTRLQRVFIELADRAGCCHVAVLLKRVIVMLVSVVELGFVYVPKGLCFM